MANGFPLDRSRFQAGHDSLPGRVHRHYYVHLPRIGMRQDCAKLADFLATTDGNYSIKSNSNLHRRWNGFLFAYYSLGLLPHYWWTVCK